jgi:hypothetical protein
MARVVQAYWNQDEVDAARHEVVQPRYLWLEVTL